MNNSIKHKVIFLTIFMFFVTHSYAGEQLLPLPKPEIDPEIKEITKKKKLIYPKKRPLIKDQTKTIVAETSTDQSSIEKIILPQKKPILVKKVIKKTASKSEILSKKDFEIAKSAFEFIKKKKWKTAIKITKKARDKTLYSLVNYLYLLQPSNEATFYDYTSFINKNFNYPRINVYYIYY